VQYWLVMPAAGSGLRFGADRPKQYELIAGRTMIEWALAPFLADERCQEAFVALSPEDCWFEELAAARHPSVCMVQGGAQRCHSVHQALCSVPADDEDWVLVHDAARPCVSRTEVDALIAAVSDDAVGGLLALPMADTLKAADADGRVSATPERRGLWRALTPQMFRLGPLRRALHEAISRDLVPTDEAQAMEWLGLAPRLVRGSAANLKVTERADLALAAAILQIKERDA
jgi:2-C-methyl-D-erythritol 4-phosphate cytidylyltransferase